MFFWGATINKLNGFSPAGHNSLFCPAMTEYFILLFILCCLPRSSEDSQCSSEKAERGGQSVLSRLGACLSNIGGDKFVKARKNIAW